jgi:gluconate 2-dehydrogenase gamma chain
MPGPRDLDRRRFLGAAGGAATLASLAACTGAGGRRGFFFTEGEWATAEALCECLIPADADPGAREAGAVEFIDRQLVGPYRRHQRTYREGLAAVEGASRTLFNQGFVALDAPRQTRLVGSLERDDVPQGAWSTRSLSPQAFFELILEHTLQGFYGDPRHGGNRDAVSWKMVGLPYPPVRGRDQYRFEREPERRG